MLALIPMSYTFFTQWLELYYKKLEGNPDYDWPKFTDFKTAVITCVGCFALRGMIMATFTPIFYTILRPKFVGEERNDRAKRAA